MTLEAGTTLGSYEILAPLGAGGMGEVYRARDTKLGREVAIKVLPEGLSDDPERMARFEREARALAALNHPNVATLYGFERDAGVPFLVMELVEGETLADRIKRGAIPLDQALPLFLQIAEGLEAAHEKGVIHRDLKPANIKVTADKNLKILDFGLAKAVAPAGTSGQDSALSQSPTLTLAATRRGEILGTAAYMSPEQAKGAAIDKRTDIWAFGACLYEALSGERAFEGDSAAETMGRVLERQPNWETLPKETPPELVALIQRCLKKEPALRLRDIGDAWVELLEPAGGADSELQKQAPERPRWVAALALAAALGAGVALGFVVARDSADTPDNTASSGRFSLALRPEGPIYFDVLDVQRLAVAPDGHRFVYVGGAPAGGTQLYTRSVGELEFRAIPGTEDGWQPFFSPDSRWLAFFTTGGELKKVNFETGARLTIVNNFANSQWALGSWGDDDHIVYSTFTSGLLRIPAAGGEAVPLTGSDDQYLGAVVLPGSQGVVYQRLTANGSHIEARSLLDGSETVLFENAANPHYLASGHLLFRRLETLLVASFAADRLEITGSPMPLELDVWVRQPLYPGALAQLAVSKSGTLLYLPSYREYFRQTLAWVGRDGSIEEIWSTTGGRRFSLAPSGRLAALTSWHEGQTHVEILDLERRVTTGLTAVPSAMWTQPLWSADGRTVLFGGGTANEGVLYRKTIESSGPPEELHRAPSYFGIAPWSLGPDGLLAFTVYDPVSEGDIRFYSLEEQAEQATQLDQAYNEQQPAFSPDGRWLAYQSDESGTFEIYLVQYPSWVGKSKLTEGGAGGPMWSPDGQRLFFSSLDGDRRFRVDLELEPELRAGEPQLLFEGLFQHAGDIARSSDLAPDGRFLLWATPGEEDSGSPPVAVLDWFSELGRELAAQ